ncbi:MULTISPECIES: acyl-CoA dehydrogenase family protein [Ramlibacter]|uniref:Acyl-CoA dehydrogenase n=1 Tax=Ramlibacter pinisoli TaxID=2682844 RepID=A0A6N8J317_9BURK|nr:MULTISPECIES: acyl-CoA dehydrogenase family protein [Ramlibacter]MBA2962664.1 acyl-CoA dehydrogenase family protein [Ramlibacter sp. CGMCC 1.13660]MVQ32606.1 acyl-CoA dehydrogenase [Ramlibacter pinisoli]
MRHIEHDDDLTHDQRLLRESVAQFMDREVRPTVAGFEKRGEFDWTLPARLREFGYLGGFLREDEGGYGISNTEYALLMEEAGYCWHSLRAILNTMNMAALLIARLGTPQQKARYLAPLLAGELRVWVGITEPNHGSNVAGMETRATRDGDEWVIDGSKLWITNGAIAELGILMAKVPPGKPGEPHGITAFLVDSRETDFGKRRVQTMVLHATTTSELNFAGTRIPAANVLGDVGKGLKNILLALSFGRLSVAAGAVGAAQAALDLSIDYAKTRRQFGAPIGSYQLIQKMVVDMRVRTDAARQLVRRAARTLDRGQPGRMECSIAKLYSAQAAHEVADLALQVHGGMGYSEDFPIERIFRDTRGAVIPEGTTEIQTLIIGRELLGMSAFGSAD